MDISIDKICIFIGTATCRTCIDLRLKFQSHRPYIYCIKYHGSSKVSVIMMPPFLRRKFKSQNKGTKTSTSFNQRPFLSCLNFVVGCAMEKARLSKGKCSKLYIITIQILWNFLISLDLQDESFSTPVGRTASMQIITRESECLKINI